MEINHGGKPVIQVAHTSRSNSGEAVVELQAQLGAIKPKVLLCFASTQQEPHELVRKLQRAYPDALVCGSTTAGEIVSGMVLKGSVVAMAIGEDVVSKVASVAIEDLGARMDLKAAFATLERHIGEPMEELDPDHHVGIVITDGMSGAEEKLIEAIAAHTEIAFIGGSAGDDLKFKKTTVFLGKNIHDHAAILVLLKVPRGFEIIKTQSFKPTGVVLEATEVNEAERKIVTLNHRPAAYAYAEAVGALPEAISEKFTSHPLARMVGVEPFIRSPQQIEGTAIKFYCAVKKGEMLSVMEATNIIADTQAAVSKVVSEAGGVTAIVDFHCILRALELEAKGLSQDYGAIFKEIPAIGFSTYGEAWTTHINQTSTMLVFR